jgi:hypothetical protein
MRNLTEQQARELIREELRSYLIEEGIMKSITAGIVTGLALAGLQYLINEPVVQAKQAVEEVEQIKNEDVINDEVFDKAEEIITKLVMKGAKEGYARQIVSRVFVGAAQEYDTQHAEKEPNFEQNKIEFINNKLGEVLQDDTLFNIVALDFIKEAENIGRRQLVTAASKQRNIGTSLPSTSISFAFADGLLASAQQDYAKAFDQSRIKKDDNGETYYLFNPMNLPYWEDKMDDGELKVLVANKLGDAKVPKRLFNSAQAVSIEKYIENKIQENKVNKLRQRINELRGVYV